MLLHVTLKLSPLSPLQRMATREALLSLASLRRRCLKTKLKRSACYGYGITGIAARGRSPGSAEAECQGHITPSVRLFFLAIERKTTRRRDGTKGVSRRSGPWRCGERWRKARKRSKARGRNERLKRKVFQWTRKIFKRSSCVLNSTAPICSRLPDSRSDRRLNKSYGNLPARRYHAQ